MTPATMPSAPPVTVGSSDFQMLNLNEVRFSGRLVQDPAIRSAIVGKVIVHLDVAVNRKYRDKEGKWHKEVAFVPVTVWSRMADYCEKGLRKGTPLYIEGRLLTDTWKTLDGKRHSALKVQASRVRALRRATPLEHIPAPAATLH